MWSSVNRDEDGAQKIFTVTLMGLLNLPPELTEDAELRYRDALVLALGGEAEVVAAWTAHEQIVDRYPDEALALGKSTEEKAAVSRWWRADRAAEMAAFVAWPIHPQQAFFEVSV
ncbi:MAG TPA: hypothetical protein VIM34_01435 [Burkholderiaceae bacterium]